MKKLIYLGLTSLVVVLMFGLNACQHDPNPIEEDQTSIQAQEFTYLDPQVSSVEIPDYSNNFEPSLVGPDFGRNQKRQPLGDLLRKLQLNREDMAALKPAFQAHYDCMKEYMAAMREETKVVMQELEVARRPILEQLKSGEITREEARVELAPIYQAAREDMKEIRDSYCEKFKECRDQLFDAIYQYLSANYPDRAARFLTWWENLPNPCDRQPSDRPGDRG
jgi:hypothetical protein